MFEDDMSMFEDGIRDMVMSRGLGDVYKRQLMNHGLSQQSSKEEHKPWK